MEHRYWSIIFSGLVATIFIDLYVIICVETVIMIDKNIERENYGKHFIENREFNNL